MAQSTTGTFTETGTSASVVGSKFLISMGFAGTATIQIQKLMPSGAWLTTESVTADYCEVWNGGGATVTLRLNCSAHTNNVEYEIKNCHA